MREITADDLAQKFMAMGPKEFSDFWMAVLFEWNIEDSDIEMQWFLNGQQAKPAVLTVISAMHSAVASGRRASERPTPTGAA